MSLSNVFDSFDYYSRAGAREFPSGEAGWKNFKKSSIMSTLSSILSTESSNTHSLYFYREGVFYKAYERSSYLFVKYVRPFQVKKRHVKSVKQDVVSVGFPTNSLPNYFSADKIKEKENVAEIGLEKEIDIHEFEFWKAEIPLYQEGSSFVAAYFQVLKGVFLFCFENAIYSYH